MNKTNKSHANRGMKLENHIENKCVEYHKAGIALIHKIPTEFKIIRNGARIVSAFPVKDSKFVDFCGIYQGKAIAIECKETQNKTSFPLSNISQYQFDFTDLWFNLGGKTFYIISFTTHDKTYMISSDILNNYVSTLDRKSIPYEWFKDNGTLLKDYNFIDYLN